MISVKLEERSGFHQEFCTAGKPCCDLHMPPASLPCLPLFLFGVVFPPVSGEQVLFFEARTLPSIKKAMLGLKQTILSH